MRCTDFLVFAGIVAAATCGPRPTQNGISAGANEGADTSQLRNWLEPAPRNDHKDFERTPEERWGTEVYCGRWDKKTLLPTELTPDKFLNQPEGEYYDSANTCFKARQQRPASK
jgi:hypothetical protein